MPELLSFLEELQNKGFIFRGHSDGKYILQPSMFRKDSLIKLIENYPEKANVHKWISSTVVNDSINAWTKGIRPWYVDRIFRQRP